MIDLAPLRRRFRRVCRTLVRTARTSVPLLWRSRAEAVKATLRFTRWLRALLILYLWISLEVEMSGWALLVRRTGPLHGWHRLVYCLLVSLTAGQLVFALGLHSSPSLWTLLAGAAHGAAVHFFWQRGVSWCKHVLGVRPSRAFDPAKPYAGLDLSN